MAQAVEDRYKMDKLSTGQICLAGSDHESTKTNELRFCNGDIILILSELMEDGLHYLASTSDGSIGQFPMSAVRKRTPIPMLPMPWYHSTISRLEAEKLLDRNQNGQFLLRTSQNTKGKYALAISYKGGVMHYLVAMNFKDRKLTVNGEMFFDNLPGLVEFYKKTTPDLCSPLRFPVVRRSTLEFFIDQEDLKQKWGLPMEEVCMVDESDILGQGEFGEVKVGTYRETQVAVKFIHDSKQSAAAVASFLREATIFTHLRHKNLVQLVGVVFQGSTIQSIVMELMGKGSLQKYLISRGRSVVSQAELLSFARDVCEGMVYVSSKGYVHRDLAARNVLLNSNGQAKISDFGLARKVDIHVPHEGGKFPVKWTAPEALKESKFTVKSDVWSFGVFLWEVYSYGRVPYPSIPADEVLEMLEDGIVMDPPDSCSDQIYSIMCRCWKMEATDRPSFTMLQQVLSKSYADPQAMFGSPVPVRKMVALPDFKVDDIVMGPVACKSYQEAPLQRKVTMLLGNIVFLGPQGSGKTSVMRVLSGEPFRLMEPTSTQIVINEGYHEIRDSHGWSHSTAGLMYEDELVRIIVEDLLKHLLSGSSKGKSNGRSNVTVTPPPLPPRRFHSFSEAHSRSTNLLTDASEIATRATNRLSGSYEVIESGTPEGKLQLGVRPQPVANNEVRRSPKTGQGLSRKKNKLGKLLYSSFRSSSKSHDRGGDIRRSYSDSVRRELRVTPDASNGHSFPPTPPPSPGPFQSPLPEQLVEKIKNELQGCSGGSLPPKYFGKLIDMPGQPAFQALKPLFVTENSLCVLTFDASKDIMSVPSPNLQRRNPQNGTHGSSSAHSNIPSYYQLSSSKHSKSSFLGQIMKEIGNVCLQWSHCNADMTLCGPRIVIVATHSDKVPSTISHRNFELLQDAIKSSPYKKYVAMLKFIVSSSSIIDRSSTDDLKHFVMELVKKACRQQVPLKWLRCVRRFQGLSRKGVYLLSLSEARKIVSQICDISDEEEIGKIVHFLHQNHVILHFNRIHQLKEIVITDPKWFATQLSHVFSASFIDLEAEGAPSELLPDQQLLRSKGKLTNQLLSFIWREKSSRVKREELLTIMHKMDLICCMASDTQPLPPVASIEDLTQDVSSKTYQPRNGIVSFVIIPSLVEETKPSHLASLPSFNVEPIVFRFKTEHIPSGLFSRLLVRCVQSYPNGYSIYKNGATFEVDPTSLLMLTLRHDHIKVSLHRIRSRHVRESLPSSMDVTDLDSLLNDPNTPNPDTCLAILMFVRATLSDLVQQWTPHLDFDLCVSCDCSAHTEEDVDCSDGTTDGEVFSRKSSCASTSSLRPRSPGDQHFVILNDVDSLYQSSVRCELGSIVPSSASLSCWFGEVPSDNFHTASPTDDLDFVTESDLQLVVKVLGTSWTELGQTLGFTRWELESISLLSQSVAQAGEKMLTQWQTLHSRSATFFTLLGSLELVQRKDIVDELVAARMAGEGIDL